MKKMILRYASEAPVFCEDTFYSHEGNSWEKHSLPLGNGYFGANLFGRCETERIQISEPSVANSWYIAKTRRRSENFGAAGVNSFADIYIDFNHKDVKDYERTLCIENAVTAVKYECGGVKYEREAFISYPDKVFAMRLSASEKNSLSFTLRTTIPYLGEYTMEPGDGLAKSGSVKCEGDSLVIDGKMQCYDLEYYGILKIAGCDGKVTYSGSQVSVAGASEAIILFTCDTSYELCEAVFNETENNNKLNGMHVNREKCKELIAGAYSKGYAELKRRHVEDYRSLYARVSFDIGGEDENLYTNELLMQYKAGKRSIYLEELMFQYGRYLIISSSRSRLPAHLQGIWNCFSDTPWAAGYWHNVNIQMNYWLTGPANLTDTFIPYINYAKAYMNSARKHADRYVKEKYPENFSGEGKNGWIIGTNAFPYEISGCMGNHSLGTPYYGPGSGIHSGPGTGPFTAILFWDYYDFTRDLEFLESFAYPALYEMSLFLTKVMFEYDGKYLVRESASPENRHNRAHYPTVGCGFDQQMVYENFKRTIEAAKILGKNDELIEKITAMLPNLDPVLIGDDGQVKEYREETTYGSIGEPDHRHISHLLGLYPGTVINTKTPEWINGARVTLTRRGDRSMGWAVILRLLCWARIRDAKKCLDLIDVFMEDTVLDNLWCTNASPFQMDGNFGYTAAVAEMLIQSHEDCIELLPALPCEWKNGSFRGLVARGNFEIDAAWKEGNLTYVKVLSRVGGEVNIKLPEGLFSKGGVFTKNTSAGEVIEFGAV